MRWVPALTVSGHPQDNGLVKDVFDKDAMKQLGEGSLGLGHVRYPTAGSSTAQEAQPFFVNSPRAFTWYVGSITSHHSPAPHKRRH